MRSMFGSISRIEKDYYRVRWSCGYDDNGRRKQKSHYIHGTREDAEMYLAKVKLDEIGEAPDNLSVSEYWNLYYRPSIDGYAVGTVRNAEHTYSKYVQPLFGNCFMSELKKPTIEQKLLTIEKEYARWNTFKLLRQMFNSAWDDDMIENNPFLKKFKRINEPRKKEQRVLKISEWAKWVDGLRGFRYAHICYIMAFGGLRREEALALDWSDIVHVFEGGKEYLFISVKRAVTDFELRDTKTENSTRTVVIAGSIASLIDSYRDTGAIFKGVNGNQISPKRFTIAYRKYCNENGVVYITPKNLRNSYATFRQANGADATVTSRTLGHTNLNIDYAHYFVTQREAYMREAEAMANAFEMV